MIWINRKQSTFSERLFPVYNRKYFLIHHSPLWPSKYHFRNDTRTVLAKQFLSKLLSSLYRKIFPFSLYPSMGFQISTCKFHKNRLSEGLLEKGFLGESCNSVSWINRTQSSFSESFFPVFNRRYFLFHRIPLWASKYHFATSTRTVLAKGFLRGKL